MTVTSRATARVNDVPYDLKPTAVATHTFQVSGTTVGHKVAPPVLGAKAEFCLTVCA